MTHRSHRALAGLAGVLVAALLSGCAEGEQYVGSGDWEAKPAPADPGIPKPQQPAPPGGGSTPSQPGEKDDGVRATGLDQPAAIAAMPDGTALVGERATGRVFKVFPAKGTPQQELYTVPEIDGSAGGGLVAMVASPYYAENGLVYAYVTTPSEGQVISLNAAGVPHTILGGLPRAAAAMTIAPDGSLLIATGGTGSPTASKVLAIDPWGGPGPAATDGLVVTSGVSNPLGLCSDGIDVYLVDGGTGAPGALVGNAVYRISGEAADSGGLTSAQTPLLSLTAGKDAGAAGCAATDVALIMAGTDSQSVMTSVLDQQAQSAGEPTLARTGEFGRLRAMAMDPITGAIWVGTYNRDGVGTPVAEDDRVLYIPPPSGGGSPEDAS